MNRSLTGYRDLGGAQTKRRALKVAKAIARGEPAYQPGEKAKQCRAQSMSFMTLGLSSHWDSARDGG